MINISCHPHCLANYPRGETHDLDPAGCRPKGYLSPWVPKDEKPCGWVSGQDMVIIIMLTRFCES